MQADHQGKRTNMDWNHLGLVDSADRASIDADAGGVRLYSWNQYISVAERELMRRCMRGTTSSWMCSHADAGAEGVRQDKVTNVVTTSRDSLWGSIDWIFNTDPSTWYEVHWSSMQFNLFGESYNGIHNETS